MFWFSTFRPPLNFVYLIMCNYFFQTSSIFSLKLELREWTSVEYYQPGVDSLDRDNVGLLAKFRPRKTTSNATTSNASTSNETTSNKISFNETTSNASTSNKTTSNASTSNETTSNEISFDEKSIFCIATTHLLFNPKRHDIKLSQVALLLAGSYIFFLLFYIGIDFFHNHYDSISVFLFCFSFWAQKMQKIAMLKMGVDH
jgi:hypothetical protein